MRFLAERMAEDVDALTDAEVRALCADDPHAERPRRAIRRALDAHGQ